MMILILIVIKIFVITSLYWHPLVYLLLQFNILLRHSSRDFQLRSQKTKIHISMNLLLVWSSTETVPRMLGLYKDKPTIKIQKQNFRLTRIFYFE